MENLDNLIQGLRGNSLDEHHNDVMDMLIVMGESIVDELIELLKYPQDNDPNEYVRGRIIKVLGEIGDVKAFESLVEASESQVEFLREKAIYALGQLDDNRAIGLLIAHLRNHWDRDTREEAAWALANYPEQWVIHFLIRAFTDSHYVVRDAAVSSLMKIGTPAIDALQEGLKNDNDLIRQYSQEALDEIDKLLKK